MTDAGRTWRGGTGPARGADLPTRVREFTWGYRGRPQRLRVAVPGWLLAYYAGRPRTPPYPTFVADPFDRDLVGAIAGRVRSFADRNDLSARERITFAARFVQAIEYVPDPVSTSHSDYHRFPVETLVYGGGDCEDASILLAAVLDALGDDVALVVFDGHVLVGVGLPDGPAASDAYYAVDDRRYVVLETTATGWDLGDCPADYESVPAELHPIGRHPVLTHRFRADASDGRARLRVDVTNLGARAVSPVDALVAFRDRSGETVARRPLRGAGGTRVRIAPNGTRRLRGSVPLPDEPLRAIAKVRVASRLWDESDGGLAPAVDRERDRSG